MKLKTVISFILSSLLVSSIAQAQTPDQARQLAQQMGYSEKDIKSLLNEKGKNSNELSYLNSEEYTRLRDDLEQDSTYRVFNDTLLVEEAKNEETQVSKETIFGHTFFKRNFVSRSKGLVPGMNLPTPKDYVIGAGDKVFIDMWGSTVSSFSDTVSPEGYVNIPDLGPVYIAGVTVEAAQKRIKTQLSTIHSGLMDTESPSIDIRLSVGSMHTIVVNIAGEAQTPGSFPLPGMSTVITALYKAQGVTDLASVRDIRIYRSGKLIDTFDLYSYIGGKFSKTLTKLQDNDLIVVPSYSARGELSGEIRRPMLYDFKEGESVESILKIAGGFNANANRDVVYIKRLSNGDTLSIGVPKEKFASFKIQDGDVLSAYAFSGITKNQCTIDGAVHTNGSFALGDDVKTLSQLLKLAGGVTSDAYTKWCIIKRHNDVYEPISISVNLENVLLGKDDVVLQENDNIHIHSLKALVNESSVYVTGAVKIESEIKYFKGMTLRDAIMLCDGFAIDATQAKIDIARRNSHTNSLLPSNTAAHVITYNLVENPQAFDVTLEPFDMIMVRQSPDYKAQQYVMVKGEVVFPGTHVVEADVVCLTDIIEQTGGFLNTAYIKGAQLSRRFTEVEKSQLEVAAKIAYEEAKQIKGDTTAVKFDVNQIGDTYTVAIDLERALADPNSDANLIMKEGDEIFIPAYTNTVKISGYIMRPVTVTYDKKLKWKDYVNLAGGFSKGSIRRKTYAIHMNGAVSTKSWGSLTVEPGDEIVVPGKEMSERNQFNFANIATATSMLASITTMIAYLTKL